MARPKLPTAVKEMKGTLRESRENPDEPRPDTGVPAMPMSLSAKEQAAWHECVATLLPMGVLTIADGLALEQLAVTIVEVRELHEQIRGNRSQKVTSTQKEEVDRQHSLYNVYNQARKELRALYTSFGIGPLARTAVHTVKPRMPQPDGDKPEAAAGPVRRTAASFFKHH